MCRPIQTARFEGDAMTRKRHVFRKLPDGHRRWVDALPSFEDARVFVDERVVKDAGEVRYFRRSRQVLLYRSKSVMQEEAN